MKHCLAIPLLVALVVTDLPATADGRFPQPVNLRTYTSPSGEFACVVDPSDLHGRGAATYRLTRKGIPVWSGEKPFTLFEAAVTDTGLVAGYSYSNGVDGFGGGGRAKGPGDFRVVILGPTGKPLLNDAIARKFSLQLHAAPDPLASGLIVDGPNDRFVVRVHEPDWEHGGESWRTYRLSSGRALGKHQLAPPSPGCRMVLQARTVPGTPLTLVHWWRYESPEVGARFSLLDLGRKEIWSLALDRDYMVPGNERAEDELQERIRRQGAILDTSRTNHFDLLFAAKSERVTFRARAGANGKWEVAEVARGKFTEPDEPTSFPRAASGEPLRRLGTFKLGSTNAVTSPVRNVLSFDIDGRDRIGLVRDDKGSRYTFVLVEPDGRLVRETPIQFPATTNKHDWPRATWIESERWLVTTTTGGAGGETTAWWLSASDGSQTSLVGLQCPPIKNLARLSGGGFVALTSKHHRYTIVDELIAFDGMGRVQWRIRQDYGGGDGALFSPEAMTVTTSNRVAVLDVIRHTVQFFDSGGKFRSVVKLDAAWGRKANYPSDLSADSDGGVVVGDFGGNPPVVRMTAEGKVRSQFQPKHTNGRVLDAVRGLKVSPAGRLWASEGEALHRLDEQGVVTATLGQVPNPEQLGHIAGVTVDSAGRLYAVDDRTGAVHIFDHTGATLRVCKPDIGDFKGKFSVAKLTARTDGSVFLSEGVGADDHAGFLHFDSGGKRLGFRKLGLDAITEEWHALPAAGRLLVLGYQDAFIVDAAGKTERTIRRGADGTWLHRPEGASVASDGSFAIWTLNRFQFGKPPVVHRYGPDGDARQTLTLPEGSLSYTLTYTGKHIATLAGPHLWVFDTAGRTLRKFTPEVEGFREDYGRVFATNGGTELWLVLTDAKLVHRYALP